MSARFTNYVLWGVRAEYSRITTRVRSRAESLGLLPDQLGPQSLPDQLTLLANYRGKGYAVLGVVAYSWAEDEETDPVMSLFDLGTGLDPAWSWSVEKAAAELGFPPEELRWHVVRHGS